MKQNRLICLILAFVLCLSACTKDDFTVNNVLVQPYIKATDNMGLSLYFQTNAKAPEEITMIIKDPSGDLSWEVKASKVEYQGTIYYGTSSICMPKGNELPKGQWVLELLYKDGNTVVQNFDVNYGKIEQIQDSNEAYYDSASNLTVIP